MRRIDWSWISTIFVLLLLGVVAAALEHCAKVRDDDAIMRCVVAGGDLKSCIKTFAPERIEP